MTTKTRRKCPPHVAAAELLAAAVALLARIDRLTTEEFSRGDEKTERERLRAAIAKATG